VLPETAGELTEKQRTGWATVEYGLKTVRAYLLKESFRRCGNTLRTLAGVFLDGWSGARCAAGWNRSKPWPAVSARIRR